MADVVVVGAGVIGLMSAYRLAQAGQRVLVLEQGEVGQEASWAGGGIVSPLYPWRYNPAVRALADWSADFYAEFSQQLAAFTGIDPEHHVTGLYWLDLADADLAIAWAEQEGKPLEQVSAERVRQQVKQLGPQYQQALYLPGVANVRNPRLLKSLRAALELHPLAEVRSGQRVTGFVCAAGQLQGVRVGEAVLPCHTAVLAAGAWSAELARSAGVELPVEPVKGQMILYRCAADFLPSMVLSDRRYAIPRRDGHVLVGSTLEHVGFDKQPTEEALASLKASAEELLPALAQQEVVKHWAGLRPGSPDGIPSIGEVPGVKGLWFNCGHYRNGLVMAPASCQLLLDLMLGQTPVIAPDAYCPPAAVQ